MKNTSHQRLILHFNIDKTLVMRDSLNYNNSDYCVKLIFYDDNFEILDKGIFFRTNLGQNRAKQKQGRNF